MRDLSLKGIARKYKGRGSSFSVRADVLGVSASAGPISLRERLETIAREGHAWDMTDRAECVCDDCLYGWTASFQQTWTHIVVRVRLNPDSNVTAATMNACRTTWANGITNCWTHRWGSGRAGELACRFSFEVQWVTSNQHHSVQVTQGGGRANMGHFYTNNGGGTAAHEYGHMIGHVDEYTDGACPGRAPVNTGTVMDNNSNTVPSRLLEIYAGNLGGAVVAI